LIHGPIFWLSTLNIERGTLNGLRVPGADVYFSTALRIVESLKSEPEPILNGALLPTRFVSKNELEAIISEGEALPESNRSDLVVGFKP